MAEIKAPDTQRIAALKQSLKDADQSVRFVAALELAKLGDMDSIPALIEGFQADGFITRLFQAGQALTTLGQAAVPALAKALTADQETVRVAAAYTLWKIDPACAQDLLPTALEALHNWNPDLNIENQVCTALIDAAIFLGDMGSAARAAMPILAEMLRTSVYREEPLAWHEDMRVLLALLITQIADPPEQAVAALREALQAEDESLRWGAARALGELGQVASEAIPALTALLTNEQEFETIRVEAAYSLAVMGDPLHETLPALTQAFESKDWWIRAYMIRILGEMGAPVENKTDREAGFWLDLIFNAERTVRRIAQPDTYIVPILKQALLDSDYNVRRNAAYALSLIGIEAGGAIPALIEAMRSPDVGPIAAEAVAKVGEPAIPALTLTLDKKDELLQRHVAYALQLIETPAAQAVFNQAQANGIKPLQPAPHHFYMQCPVSFETNKKAAFEALYEETVAREVGSEVSYTLPYPKHEFLRYLVEYKGLFMHGTDRPDLEVLQPQSDSTSTEESGRVHGIYADKGYMRPLYFAVVHRRRCPALHNGFFDLREDGTITHDEDQGFDRRYYKLAIDITSLRRDPWRNGTVYALPPDTFEFWEEWTSRVPVRPVLRLAVTPDDLPLKEDVWGTDYRMFSQGNWVSLGKDAFPFLKDIRTTPFHTVGQPPWLRQT